MVVQVGEQVGGVLWMSKGGEESVEALPAVAVRTYPELLLSMNRPGNDATPPVVVADTVLVDPLNFPLPGLFLKDRVTLVPSDTGLTPSVTAT